MFVTFLRLRYLFLSFFLRILWRCGTDAGIPAPNRALIVIFIVAAHIGVLRRGIVNVAGYGRWRCCWRGVGMRASISLYLYLTPAL